MRKEGTLLPDTNFMTKAMESLTTYALCTEDVTICNMHATLKFMSIFYIRLANVGMLRHEEQSHARATHSSEEAAVADKTLRK